MKLLEVLSIIAATVIIKHIYDKTNQNERDIDEILSFLEDDANEELLNSMEWGYIHNWNMGEETKLLLMQNEVEHRKQEMLKQHRNSLDAPCKVTNQRLDKSVAEYEKALNELSKMKKFVGLNGLQSA